MITIGQLAALVELVHDRGHRLARTQPPRDLPDHPGGVFVPLDRLALDPMIHDPEWRAVR